MLKPKNNLLIITLLFFANILFASDTTNSKSNCMGNEEVFQIKLLIDTTRSFNIDQVEQKQHEAKIINPQYIIPSTEVDYWFIIEYENLKNVEIEQYFGFDIACFEIADLYYKDSTDWIHIKNGLLIPIEKREVYSRLPGFEVTFKPYEEKTLYLHLHSKYLVPTEIVSTRTTTFKKTEQKYLFVYWFYIGAAFSILLYNLLLFIQLRDKVYLYYILYVTCLLIWISLDSGLFLYFNSNIKLYYFLSIGSPTMAFFLTLFTREILKIRQVSKWMDTSLIVMSVIYMIIAILVSFDLYYYQFLGLIAMPFTLFLLFVGVYGMIKKLPLSKFYVLASSFYIIGLFMYAGLTLNAIPYTPLTRYGFMIGSFLELIVFSLALGYKIKLIQAEKLKFQEKIVENERDMNKNLEIKVKERTEELLATSEQLENTNALLSIQIDNNDNVIKALKKSDSKLQESNNAKDKFFSIIAHDLKSPFNGILGFSNLLIEKIQKKDYNGIEKYAKIIQGSSQRAVDLLMNLMQWSRSQTGKMDFNPRKVDIVELINTITKLLTDAAIQKSITIGKKLPNNVQVSGDIDMISTILRNLISNAIKFTHPNGKIIISAEQQKNELMICVSDNGIGIDIITLEKLFRIEESISTPGTQKEKGTGLGLILCKEFVEKIGGKIWVESEEGKGSDFKFTLPLYSV
jgi:signal transduction histidine kinase